MLNIYLQKFHTKLHTSIKNYILIIKSYKGDITKQHIDT